MTKILIVGGGGREHALAWKLSRDDPSATIFAAPGNPGIAECATCVPIKADDVQGLLAFVQSQGIDLTVVGPEAPLAAGIVDLFREEGLAIFGPTQQAAQIETSKRFAKEIMAKAGVPTAYASHHTTPESAKRAVAECSVPIVIKASGLAAGKGVIIAQTLQEAEQAIDSMLLDNAFGSAGNEILIEEFMHGEELSVFAVCDGTHAMMMLGGQDHKRLLDGDAGPNTGGMGAYAPVSIDTPDIRDIVMQRIFIPTLSALRDAGMPFTGLLYAGLMLTPDGPKVVEFNCRFGDPETQALLPLLDSSLLEPLSRVARGESIESCAPFVWRQGASVTTVVAAAGYPNTVKTGDRIQLPDAQSDVFVFHAGTKREDNAVVTSGGRVLAVTAIADSLEEAATKSRTYAERIQFDGKQMRKDIGWRELARHARAS